MHYFPSSGHPGSKRELQDSLMSGVWQHLRSAGMPWSTVGDSRSLHDIYDRGAGNPERADDAMLAVLSGATLRRT